MKEIKFRGFSKILNTWIYGNLIQSGSKFYIAKQGFLTPYECLGTPVGVLGFENNEDIFEVEPESIGQYTGLKDKNGKEIYEGDILALKTHYNDVVFGFVVFNYGAFCLSSRETYYDDELISNLGVEFEVIGNVFENPGLLESAK